MKIINFIKKNYKAFILISILNIFILTNINIDFDEKKQEKLEKIKNIQTHINDLEKQNIKLKIYLKKENEKRMLEEILKNDFLIYENK